jgi:3'-5' exoribonuclease
MSADLPRPTITRLADLKPGERGYFFALLAERTRHTTQKNKAFFNCRFKDTRRTATYMVWSDGPHFQACESDWKVGKFFKLHATFSEHERYGSQIDVHKIRPVELRDASEGFNPTDFGEHSRFDPGEMFVELRGLVETTIVDEPLRRLTLGLIDRHAEKLKQLPATLRNFYPFPGGWLEHTLSVARSAIWLVDRYRERYPELRPPLNKDLVVAGAALHHIGAAQGLEPATCLGEPPKETIDGQFFGHLFLGRDMVRDAAREQGDVNAELVRMLEHMVLTHLALPEWGSPRLPLIPEVLILHHADDLDAKLEMYARCLTKDVGPGPFTERDPVLGKALFKGREV